MARFRVLIAPGVTHLVDAATEDEARKKTKAEIAKGSISPFYDELFFDYETGVNNREYENFVAGIEKLESGVGDFQQKGYSVNIFKDGGIVSIFEMTKPLNAQR